MRICLDWGVIPERIFPAFRRFGLLQFQYDPDRERQAPAQCITQGDGSFIVPSTGSQSRHWASEVITILHQTPVTTYNTKVN